MTLAETFFGKFILQILDPTKWLSSEISDPKTWRAHPRTQTWRLPPGFTWGSPCIMCVQYIGGCSVHRGVFSTSGDIMSTSGDVQYIGGCSVHRSDIMIHVGEQLDKILSISIENSDVLNIPRCTEHPPMYS